VSVDAHTLTFYNAEAAAYAERSQVSPFLADFMAELPSGASVLDLGCGGGQDSAALRDAGFAVTSLDISPGLAAEAKRRWNIDIIVADFAALPLGVNFDGAWVSGSLHHARREDLPATFAAIRQALRPGLLHASLKAGDVDRRDRFGRFFCANG
jgi:SAM-dependent methyltransferase